MTAANDRVPGLRILYRLPSASTTTSCGSTDEGRTRWVLEPYEFNPTSIHNADIRSGKLHHWFDVIILADQAARDIVDGYDAPAIRPEYRGGIGEEGVNALKQFIAAGGTL